MASWWKKAKKKVATFLAIVAMIAILVAVPIMIAASVAIPIVVITGIAAAGVGILAFMIDSQAATLGIAKVGDGIAAVAGGVAEAASKTANKVVEGAASGLLSGPVGIILLVVGGYFIYTEFFEEDKNNVTINLPAEAGSDKSVDFGDRPVDYISSGRQKDNVEH